jgi:hypothetical protein
MQFYTTILDAKQELLLRWQDKELKERVRAFLGGELPLPFREEPRAVLSRNIISPDHELHHFLEQAKAAGLKPLGLEGVDDQFVTNNEDKMLLVKPRIFKGYNRHQQVISQCKLIVDIAASERRNFSKINTRWGENLVAFHHRLMRKYAPELELFDDFLWYQ